MRLFKLAIISLIFLFLIMLGVSLLIPSHVRISKAINIYAKQEVILSQLKDTGGWSHWNPMFMIHSKSPVGISRSLIKLNDSEVIYTLKQGSHQAVINGWQIYRHAAPGDSLTLQWYLDLQTGWLPWQKFSSMFYEGSYGLIMQQGLQQLKTQIEQ